MESASQQSVLRKDMLAPCDSHGTGRLLAQLRSAHPFRFDLIEAMANRLQKTFAGRCRRNTTRGTREQPNLKPCLQATYGSTKR